MSVPAINLASLETTLKSLRDELSDVCAFLRTEDESPFTPLCRTDVRILHDRLFVTVREIDNVLPLSESEGA